MSYFLVRVELHSATSEDYQALHDYMQKSGFKTTIRSDNNVDYQLPTAQYIKPKTGTMSAQLVLNSIQPSIDAICNNWIIVSEVTNSYWQLTKAQ